jgi:hypothetical protein
MTIGVKTKVCRMQTTVKTPIGRLKDTKQIAFDFVKKQRPNVSPNDVMMKVYECL